MMNTIWYREVEMALSELKIDTVGKNNIIKSGGMEI